MKRIRLYVPDQWPEDFKLYAKAWKHLSQLVAIRGADRIQSRDMTDTFKVLCGFESSPFAVPSFVAWAAIMGATTITELREILQKQHGASAEQAPLPVDDSPGGEA